MPPIPPHYSECLLFGPFYRRASETQDAAAVREQLRSGELWGLPSRFSGDIPIAQAYRGGLPEGTPGIEFLSFAPPNKKYGPIPEWRFPLGELVRVEPHPRLEVQVVKLKVAILRVTQEL
jgi:hypothetical protein